MTSERAMELQESLAKEAIAMLVIHKGFETGTYEQSIRLIGKAGALPKEVTQRSLDLIAQELEAVAEVNEPYEAKHVLPETELPMNASGLQTLDNIWGLFEAAVQLDDASERMVLFNLAKELEETQNLLDWINQTPEEKQAWMNPEQTV